MSLGYEWQSLFKLCLPVFSQSSYHGSGKIWPMRTSQSDRGGDKAGSGRVEPWRKFVRDLTSGSHHQSMWQFSSFITESILKPLLTASSLSVSRSHDLQEPSVKDRIILPAIKLNRFTNHTTSYTIKNPTGELFTYTPSGKVRTLQLIKVIVQFVCRPNPIAEVNVSNAHFCKPCICWNCTFFGVSISISCCDNAVLQTWLSLGTKNTWLGFGKKNHDLNYVVLSAQTHNKIVPTSI